MLLSVCHGALAMTAICHGIVLANAHMIEEVHVVA